MGSGLSTSPDQNCIVAGRAPEQRSGSNSLFPTSQYSSGIAEYAALRTPSYSGQARMETSDPDSLGYFDRKGGAEKDHADLQYAVFLEFKDRVVEV